MFLCKPLTGLAHDLVASTSACKTFSFHKSLSQTQCAFDAMSSLSLNRSLGLDDCTTMCDLYCKVLTDETMNNDIAM